MCDENCVMKMVMKLDEILWNLGGGRGLILIALTSLWRRKQHFEKKRLSSHPRLQGKPQRIHHVSFLWAPLWCERNSTPASWQRPLVSDRTFCRAVDPSHPVAARMRRSKCDSNLKPCDLDFYSPNPEPEPPIPKVTSDLYATMLESETLSPYHNRQSPIHNLYLNIGIGPQFDLHHHRLTSAGQQWISKAAPNHKFWTPNWPPYFERLAQGWTLNRRPCNIAVNPHKPADRLSNIIPLPHGFPPPKSIPYA